MNAVTSLLLSRGTDTADKEAPVGKKFIYADCAATTRISENALNAMMPYLTDQFGNASGIYGAGRKARRAVETAREQTALALGCNPSEIYFTSGGTEADNWALRGAFAALSASGRNHIITTAIEHHAVLNTCEMLKKQGAEITIVPVSPDGTVNPDDIRNVITDRTAVVSVMYANNETGVIQPVSEIGKICAERGVLFHTDAVQAVPHIQINVHEQNIDMLSLSAHKFHGPKGAGVLFIKDGTDISPLIYGGAQEDRMRAGTENTAAVAGLGQAVSDIFPNLEERNRYISSLRNKLEDKLTENDGVTVNGRNSTRLPGHSSISVRNADGEQLLLMMDLKGICVSGGSACTSGDTEPSHVLAAMGVPEDCIRGSVRFSLDENNTEEDIDYIAEIFAEILKKTGRM